MTPTPHDEPAGDRPTPSSGDLPPAPMPVEQPGPPLPGHLPGMPPPEVAALPAHLRKVARAQRPIPTWRIVLTYLAGVLGVGATVLTVTAFLDPDPYAALLIVLTLPALLVSAVLGIWHLVSTVRRWDLHPQHRRRMLLPLVVPPLSLLLFVPSAASNLHDRRVDARLDDLEWRAGEAVTDAVRDTVDLADTAAPGGLTIGDIRRANADLLRRAFPDGTGLVTGWDVTVELLDHDGDGLVDHALVEGHRDAGWACLAVGDTYVAYAVIDFERAQPGIDAWSSSRPASCP